MAPTSLTFESAADSAGKTITATSTGTVNAASSESWCTVSVSGKVVTVKVAANNGASARKAHVTVQDDTKAATVQVTQAGTSI